MVTSLVLFAVETVPLLVYIFVGLVVLAVPVAVIWDKVVQPKLDAKKKLAKDKAGKQSEGAAEPVMEGIEGAEDDGEPDVIVEDLAMPAEGEVFVAEPGEAEPEEPAFEEALPDDAFSIDTGEKPQG